MSKANTTAAAGKNAPAPAPLEGTGEGQAKETPAQALMRQAMEGLSFRERFALVCSSARWSDVAAAARALRDLHADAVENGKGETPAKMAKHLATFAPLAAMEFRLALVSYVRGKGDFPNDVQMGEIFASLPGLRVAGKLGDKSMTLGNLALPPLVGEFGA